MSTAQRELEELRKIREAERLRLQEEKRIEDEKQAVKDKRNAFMAKANAFTAKKGPTDEEVKASIQKASQQRKFGNKLNKALSATPGKNSLAVELQLRGRVGQNDDDYTEAAAQEGGPAPPPPPPPPQRLVGLPHAPPPPPPPPPAVATQPHAPPPPPAPPAPAAAAAAAAVSAVVDVAVVEECNLSAGPAVTWVYVCENEPTPYYWNMETNETTFDRPDDFVDAPESVWKDNGSDEVVWWQEYVDAEGACMYWNLSSGEVVAVRPVGHVLVVGENDVGEEVRWWGREDVTEDGGSVWVYVHQVTGEETYERPQGNLLIAEGGSSTTTTTTSA